MDRRHWERDHLQHRMILNYYFLKNGKSYNKGFLPSECKRKHASVVKRSTVKHNFWTIYCVDDMYVGRGTLDFAEYLFKVSRELFNKINPGITKEK